MRGVICRGQRALTSFHQDLRLKEEGREMIYKGTLNKRGGGQGDSGDLMVFLFDHALLMVKPKTKVEQYKVYRRVCIYRSSWLSSLTLSSASSPSL